MSRFETHLPVVNLHSGELFFTQHSTLITTILGSCVSLTMYYNVRTKIAGMCHILLPSCSRKKQCSKPCTEMFRYLNCTVRYMVKYFEQHNILRKEIEVKVFGGSDILALTDNGRGRKSVGKQNIEMAKKTLHYEHINVKAVHVGGTFGRKIFFFTDTGEVLVKRIKKSLLPKQETEI